MIKKENILESARNVLSQQGITKLSLRKIAAETGCAAPSIYYYFRNKQEIVAGLWEAIAPDLLRQLSNPASYDTAYSDFWLQRPDDFKLFITQAEYYPYVSQTPAYQQLRSLLGDRLVELNGRLMDRIYTTTGQTFEQR
ncbi:TetR/AcrR family transcriptional regulator [Saccharospirillum sp. MSK14-1]|uniref:TetR/AcrR family transcriptional regulator n=1 Tax=Saccharospirillum sp. MSK14-1 TaxID=1897632 RepID=UPI000D35B61E|nr:TetR family transcriptional regulator [Saccharospirillum sp. MSK14-1]